MEEKTKEKTIHKGEQGIAGEIIQEEERKTGKKTFNEEEEELLNIGLGMGVLEGIRYWRCMKKLLPPDKFSKKFRKEMDRQFTKSLKRSAKLKRKEEQIEESHVWKCFFRVKTPAYVMIGFFAVISLGVGIETEAIPFPKFTYTLKKEEKAYEYIADREDSLEEIISELYQPIKIPRGFKVVKTVESNLLHKIEYEYSENEEGFTLFRQATKTYAIKLDLIKDYKEMVFNESKYYINEKNQIISIVWYENGYQFYIRSNFCTNRELIEMALSVRTQ